MLGLDPEGPAAKAGIKVQDIVLMIDGNKLNGRQGVLDLVTDLRPGTTVDVKLLRDGKELTVPVTVGEDTRE